MSDPHDRPPDPEPDSESELPTRDLPHEQTRAFLAAIVDSSDDAIVGKTLDGIVRSWNPGAQRVFGYAPEEMIGQSILKLIPPELHMEEQEILARLERGQRIDHFETTRIRKGGERIEVSITVSPIRNAEGRIVGASKVARDITERRRVERSLLESESRFHTLADNIAQLAWMADPSGALFWYNQRWFEYTGTTFEEMKGWGWKAVHHPDHLDRVVEEFQRAVEAGEEWEDTFPLRGRDGKYRWFLSRALPIRDDEGRVLRWFGTNTDITERIAMEEALRLADRRKDEFLATLAHELRNPLAPIRSSVQLLAKAAEDPELLAEVTDTLDRQTTHLVRLVDDLMDVSRISRGKVELRRTRVGLASVLETAVEVSLSLRERKKHRLRTVLPSEPIWLDADPVRLAQVFGNLLNNAAKYTPEGGDLELIAEASGDDAIVRVVDSGRGIEQSMLGEIFEPFVQVPEPGAGSDTGLGIGLTLVRSLVELHGGSIVARSAGRAQGSEFEVRLPRMKQAPAPSPAPRIERPRTGSEDPRSIFVVDDNRDAADALVTLLEMEGHRPRALYDGRSVLEAGPKVCPDVVVLDLGMPEMDGYETARRLRSTDWGADLTLIALTGWGQSHDREQSRAAGFDHHLVKPVEIGRLLDLLESDDLSIRRSDRSSS